MFGKIFGVINKEKEEFQKNIYQKSAGFRDTHIFSPESCSELEKKIKEGAKGLFLIPFCNNLDCEKKIKEKIPSYSIRCLSWREKESITRSCIFCQKISQNTAYLGRSY
jgi:prolyl-tRNA synthetase